MLKCVNRFVYINLIFVYLCKQLNDIQNGSLHTNIFRKRKLSD